MASTKNSKKNKVVKNGSITLDFTESLNKQIEDLNAPRKGTMKVLKGSLWKRFKTWFKTLLK